jgi:hypothetical protein
MAERPVVGGILGPTFACLLGQQFANLRNGDRFWYENDPQTNPGAFSPEQLLEIRKVTLSRVICDNLDDVDKLQPYSFLMPDEHSNKPMSCHSGAIPGLDLERWREDPGAVRPTVLSAITSAWYQFQHARPTKAPTVENDHKTQMNIPEFREPSHFTKELPRHLSHDHFLAFYDDEFGNSLAFPDDDGDFDGDGRSAHDRQTELHRLARMFDALPKKPSAA